MLNESHPWSVLERVSLLPFRFFHPVEKPTSLFEATAVEYYGWACPIDVHAELYSWIFLIFQVLAEFGWNNDVTNFIANFIAEN